MRVMLRWLAIGAGLVLVVTAGLGWASYRKFSGNIRTDSAAEQVLAQYAGLRPRALVPRARNILVMGAGAGSGAGTDTRTAAAGPGADSAVLLHLSADRARAAAVAVPRDLMVSAPSCRRPDGGASPAAYERFGLAFRNGGAACSIRAFEGLTGIRVDHHLVVDMAGLARIETAVGGGASAAAGRKGTGAEEGSRHRDLLRTLSGRSHDGGPLAHPARFFGLLDTATSSITADPGLNSLPALYELAGSLRRVLADRMVFRTLPARPLQEADAGALLAALRTDGPVGPEPGREPGPVPENPLTSGNK